MTYPYSTLRPTRLYAAYGWHVDLAHVQFHAKLDDPNQILRSGSVVHVTSDLLFAAGVGSDDVMPCLLFSHPGETDVSGLPELDPLTDKYAWVGMALPGLALAFPCSGSFEFVSCQYDTTQDYPPNTLLTSPKEPSADAGKLTVGVKYHDTICGMVSRGVINNGYKENALAFWSMVILPT